MHIAKLLFNKSHANHVAETGRWWYVSGLLPWFTLVARITRQLGLSRPNPQREINFFDTQDKEPPHQREVRKPQLWQRSRSHCSWSFHFGRMFVDKIRTVSNSFTVRVSFYATSAGNGRSCAYDIILAGHSRDKKQDHCCASAGHCLIDTANVG